MLCFPPNSRRGAPGDGDIPPGIMAGNRVRYHGFPIFAEFYHHFYFLSIRLKSAYKNYFLVITTIFSPLFYRL